MNILFVQNFYFKNNNGGAALLCGDLMTFFRGLGHAVTLLTSRTDAHLPGITIINSLQSLPIVKYKKEMETIPYKVRWTLAERFNRKVTTSAIRATEPDVIYIHNLEWLTFGPINAAIESGVRVVLHAHNHLYDNINNKSVEVIAISKSIARGIRCIPLERIHTIYNGIPSAAFLPSDFSQQRPLTAVFAGSISPHKGVHVAIEAVIKANEQGLPLKLEVIGSGSNTEYLEKCREIIRTRHAESYITLSGALQREEVWKKLSENMFLLFPSLCEEAFGLIAAEAMANGAIVIGSNQGAIPEVVGECGRVVDPDAETLAWAIREIASLPHDELVSLRIRAYKRAATMFRLEGRFKEIEWIVCGRP